MGNRRSFHIMSNPNRKFRQCSILMLMIVQCCHSVCCAGHKTTQDAEVSLTDSKYNPRRDVYSADTKDAKYGVEYTTAVSNYNMSTFTYPAIANDVSTIILNMHFFFHLPFPSSLPPTPTSQPPSSLNPVLTKFFPLILNTCCGK